MWTNPATAARYHPTNHVGDDAYARRVYRNWIRWVTQSLSVVARSLKRGNSLVVDSVTAFPILGPGWAFRHIIYLSVLLRRTGCSSTTDLCNLYTLYEVRIFDKLEKNATYLILVLLWQRCLRLSNLLLVDRGRNPAWCNSAKDWVELGSLFKDVSMHETFCLFYTAVMFFTWAVKIIIGGSWIS